MTPLPDIPQYADQAERERQIALNNVITVASFIQKEHANLPLEELVLWKKYLVYMEGVHMALAQLSAFWLTGSSDLPRAIIPSYSEKVADLN